MFFVDPDPTFFPNTGPYVKKSSDTNFPLGKVRFGSRSGLNIQDRYTFRIMLGQLYN